jgi:hypothetical protein
MIDINQAQFEPTKTVGVVLPMSMANEIERRARAELTGKSSWIRRLVLTELNKEAGASQ